ncbi:hypothetical protein [Acetobacterium wieringae]|uniref:hypothetical protein n=1 Tax=Acetobacterium wieringae TaxID=52694 RepID=UPI003157F8A8
MYSNIGIDEIRVTCRRQLESFEFWARRFIHQQLNNVYGENYFYQKYPDGNNLIKKSLQDEVKERMDTNPDRYTRPVDALLFNDIIDILYNGELYKTLFKKALDSVYSCGREELKSVLNRLIPVRNNLSHANPISIRQAEQVICYTNDFIEAIRLFYKKENLSMSYNVPQIIKIVDSFGEECYRENFTETATGAIWSFKGRNNFELRPGEFYKVDIEIDPTFNNDEYDIIWKVQQTEISEYKNKKYIEFEVTEKQVAQIFQFNCTIVSKKSWHKYLHYDDNLSIWVRVLPPIE